MTMKLKVGDHVTWNSEAGHVSGRITKAQGCGVKEEKRLRSRAPNQTRRKECSLTIAVPGLIDLLYDKGGATPVKNMALTHMEINLSVFMLYAIAVSGRLDGQMV